MTDITGRCLYLIDHGGIPTRDGDTGKLLAALEPKEQDNG